MVRFTPHSRPIAGTDHFWGRYQMQEGLSIVRQNGVLGYLPIPDPDDLAGLTEGVDFFIGGHVYRVTDDVYDELVDAGLANSLVGYPFGQGPFGSGPFGGNV